MVEINSVTLAKTSLAVDGQGIYFYFDRKRRTPILRGVNVTIPRGTIYSLLGPSGCGKTTLLKCIVGQHKVQEGSLKVYGRVPGSKGFFIPGRGVGYMPQDMSLYLEMTIEEILIYFGSLCGMNMRGIKERIQFLIELLELPDGKRIIKNLSGGQQRRVSFAVALVHKPPLLILDEPTVGVDPLLRQTIWNHLVALAKTEHLTILITTHYTEEARQADTVGLMRNGQLLCERNPENLIKQYGVVTLEDVFLRLCQKKSDADDDPEANSGALNSVETVKPYCLMQNGTVRHKNGTDKSSCANDTDVLSTYNETFHETSGGENNTTALLSASSHSDEFNNDCVATSYIESWKRFSSITRKNFLRYRRNIFALIFSICVPAVEIVIFCLCYASSPFGLQVAVANMEENGNEYGKMFLNSINDWTIYQKPYHNITLAHESVKNGESWAAIYINPEFSTCLSDRIFEGSDASGDTIDCSMVKLHIDMSNQIIASTIYASLSISYQAFVSDMLESFGKNPLLAQLGVHMDDIVYGSENLTIRDYAAPGIILGVVYIISIALTTMSTIEERQLGIFDRSYAAGATATEIMMSLFTSMLFIMFLQVVLMLTFTFFIFNIPCSGSFFWIIVCCIVVGICGMTYGILVSSITDDINTATVIIVASSFPTLLLSGVMYPVEAMPYFLRYFSYCLPLTQIIDTMRSIMTRGWNISDHHIWDGYLLCSGWAIVYMILAITVLKYRK